MTAAALFLEVFRAERRAAEDALTIARAERWAKGDVEFLRARARYNDACDREAWAEEQSTEPKGTP